MAWPDEAGILGDIHKPRTRRARGKATPRVYPGRAREDDPGGFLQRFAGAGLGKIRAFADAEYRFYRKLDGPPDETDTPYATSPTLPAQPAILFGDGKWFISVDYFNGIVGSGFYPIGPSGEPYLILEISGGAELPQRPDGPIDVSLVQRDFGIVEIRAVAVNPGYEYAEPLEWAINWTSDGSTPPADSPNEIIAMRPDPGIEHLVFQTFPQSDGTLVKVRVQIRRKDPAGYTYSTGFQVVEIVADSSAPNPVAGGDRHRGALPEV